MAVGAAAAAAGERAALVAAERALTATVAASITPAVLLARYVKAVIDVRVLVLVSDGSEAVAGVVGAALALADAGVEMSDLVTAAAVAGVPGALRVDPSPGETAAATLSCYLAALPHTSTVAHLAHTRC